MILKLALLILFLAAAAAARPDEAMGVVTTVEDGDTFEVDGFGTVRLADVQCPQMGTADGAHAREYTQEILIGAQVFLDIDNSTGRNPHGPTPCVVYLARSDGTPDLNRNFNQMVLSSGHGKVWKEPGSEFDPYSW